MAREMTIHCDRCGTEVMPKQRISYIVNAGRFRTLVHDRQIDLCIPCGQILQKWLADGSVDILTVPDGTTVKPEDDYNF